MNYTRKILSEIILLADDRPSFIEKITYCFNIIITFAPVAYFLDVFNLWFQTNHQFSSFLILCVVGNMGVGARFHYKMGTFSWIDFWKKNSEMFLVLVVVYAFLEMLRVTTGNNLVGEGFKILIQVMTLFYPISKALKNIYILTNKRYPPTFIMDKMYNFEKTGNLKDLLDTDNKE